MNSKQIKFQMSESLKNSLKDVKLDGNLLDIEKIKREINVPVDNLEVDKSRLNFRFKDGSSFNTKVKGGEWNQAILIDNKEKITSNIIINLLGLNFILLLILYFLLRETITFWKVLLTLISVSALFIISQRTLFRYGILYRK